MSLFARLEPLKSADIPQRQGSFWQLVGPGAVLVGLSIGAGEIVIWPRIIAQYGAGMAWAAVVGVFLQLWINFEIGRWTIATGETAYTGFSRVWRGFGPLFIVLNIMAWLAPGWAQTSGSAAKAFLAGPTFSAGTFWGSNTFWTCATFGVVWLLLFGPKMIYNTIEKSIELMVITVTGGLIIVAFVVGTGATWLELGKGMINIGYKHPEFGVKELFIALVFAGAGGTSNLFYSFYLRDKNIGMGGLIPDLQNPLRGRTETVPSTGYIYPETPTNASRFQSWFRYLCGDQVLFFWGLNTFTLMLFIFGALAVLHARGIVPEQGSLIWDESIILGEAFSKWGLGWIGQKLFLLVGVATMFSTQLAIVDGVARSIADIVYTNFQKARSKELSWWYAVVAMTWIVLGCGITAINESLGIKELGVLFNAAYMGGFAMAIYVPLTLYMNLKYLPKSARPGWPCIVMNVIATLLYVGFAIYCIGWEINARMN